MAGAESCSHEAAGIPFLCLGDASRHMQVLDSGVPDITERSTKVFVVVVHIVDRQRVAVAVEGAAEIHVLATAHHLGGRC